MCVDSKLQSYTASALQYDSLITHLPVRTDEQSYYPFVGMYGTVGTGGACRGE